jgi:glycosyltransferase involved in cell wall biosynthesis
MKIAQITHSYYPHIGGIEVHVREISERLAKHHDVNVITADLEHGLSRTENLNGVKISRFPSLKIGNTGYFSPNIYQHLKKNAFDIIHAHNYHALPAYIASKGAKDNFIFTPHYHGKGSTNLTNVLLKPYHYFGKNIFQTARTIICVSEFEKNLIIRDFHPSENKIKVIPNGINLKDIQKAQPYDFDGKYRSHDSSNAFFTKSPIFHYR